jgi:DNA repair protein RadD
MTGLRPYQDAAIAGIREALAGEARAVLLVLPTGAGKTRVAAELIRAAEAEGERVLFLAPRRELVHQASRALTREGVQHGLIQAGAVRGVDSYARVQVASIDTLLSRVVRRSKLKLSDPHLIVVDEAHLCITAARTGLLAKWPEAKVVGLTATPTRKDGRALGAVFERIIEPTTVAQLTIDGYLVPARYFSIAEPDLKGVGVVAGDYNAGALERAMNQPSLVGDVVATWLQRGGTRRTVVFASSIAHSLALCEEFQRAGVAAEHVDAGTDQASRDAVFSRFSCGETQVLVNVMLASYGFDLPELSCVVLARPTKSLMLYLQMIGRGLRPADGKSDCLVLDHSGAVHRHGFAAEAREWTLDGDRALVKRDAAAGAAREAAEPIKCPECSALFVALRKCPECGHELQVRAKMVKSATGELVEIGELKRVNEASRTFYLELRSIALERNWKPNSADAHYKHKTGSWPVWKWRFERPLPPSLETRRWVQSRMIAWQKGQERRSASG